jgi:chemotaxis protein methyltransferase CheR
VHEVGALGAGEFKQFRTWIHDVAGISLSDTKHALVRGRLAPRIRHHRLASYGDYFRLLVNGKFPGEAQIAVDLLTTNETHFFREPKHFEFLRTRIVPDHPGTRPMRVWSAACSSGEEPYSIAMTLAATMGARPWEILGTDLSTRVLERARRGHYGLARAGGIPPEYLRDYCLKGIGPQEGTLLVDEALRARVQFMQVNLNGAYPRFGPFDVIFLRNVMIYFDMPTKRRLVARLLDHLRPGGHLFVGHAESLNGVNDVLRPAVVSVYRKP